MMNKAPNEFLCPISMELMEDPVLCEDGQTYERKHITEWLQRSRTSPITRQPMGMTIMVSNYALKASIQRWKEQKPLPSAPPAYDYPLPSAPPAYDHPVPSAPPAYDYPRPPSQPSYTSVYIPPTPPQLIPYTPPSMYPSYQQQTATTNLSIVPRPQQLPSTQPANDQKRGKKILGLACVLLLFLVILSAILSSSPPSRTNNDDDN